MKDVKKRKNLEGQFFKARIFSVAADTPLQYDLYLIVNEKTSLFRKQGDTLSERRLEALHEHGATEFLIPEEQRHVYLQSMMQAIRNPDTKIDTKSRIIKESAYLHINDLFIKKDVGQAIQETEPLMEEMVSFVTTDVEAVASLMSLSAHDYYTYNHCVNVAVYAIALAKKVMGNDKKILMEAGYGGLLHDIGKKSIDWAVINKEGPLTQKEWDELRKHPSYGRRYVKDIGSISRDAKLVVYQHHENYDGSGYPEGVSGEDICKLSRIVSIADVFDALTTNRMYRKKCPPDEAVAMMNSMQPGKFDVDIFKTFDKKFTKKSPVKLDSDFDPCQPQPIILKSK